MPIPRMNSQSFAVCALVCAMLIPRLAIAQDLHAVERRLAEGVVAGELSLEQAAEMMRHLREIAHHEKRHHEKHDVGAEIGEWIESVAHDLKRAVEDGKLSEEDAWKKWAHFKERELHPKLRHAVEKGHMREEHAREIMFSAGRREAEERLKAAVDRGDISEREARQKLEEIERRHHHDRKRHEEHREGREREHAEGKHHDERMAKYRALEARIRRAVESGDMSREEAEKKLHAIRREIWHGEESRKKSDAGHDRREAHLKHVWAELQRAVKAGKLSKEDAERKMIAIKKGAYGKDAHGKDAKGNYYEAVERKLKAAVESGQLTEEEAKRKWESIKKGAAKKKAEPARKKSKGDYHEKELNAYFEKVWSELQAAVKAGKISEKEARAKMIAIKKEKLRSRGK